MQRLSCIESFQSHWSILIKTHQRCSEEYATRHCFAISNADIDVDLATQLLFAVVLDTTSIYLDHTVSSREFKAPDVRCMCIFAGNPQWQFALQTKLVG
jgi:hypothetical protein